MLIDFQGLWREKDPNLMNSDIKQVSFSIILYKVKKNFHICDEKWSIKHYKVNFVFF